MSSHDEVVVEVPLDWREKTVLSLADFAASIAEIRESLPEACLKTAKVRFTPGTPGDVCHFQVFYTRDQTQEDVKRKTARLLEGQKAAALAEVERRFAPRNDAPASRS